MIRGHFLASAGIKRPFVKAIFQFPTISTRTIDVELLVDTGADRTILAPRDVSRLLWDLQLNLGGLPRGPRNVGVGGGTATRSISVVINLDGFSANLLLPLMEPPPGLPSPIPSLLGRDILSRFALYVEDRRDLVLLLSPREADALNLQ